MSNEIKTYAKDTLYFPLTVLSDTSIDYTGFTAYIVIDFLTGKTTVTGDTISSDGITTFTIPSSVTDQKPNVYDYDIYLERNSEIYHIIKDAFVILPSLT
jgi:hypothetical protein